MDNGAVGELIFHNRYSYANGNPVNIVDPSGMIGERPQQYANCAGDGGSSRGKPCCGPDATTWIYNEIGRHAAYARREWLQSLEIGEVKLWRLMAYGLAVDYSNVPYRALSGTTTPESYSCGREDYISVCGRCHHASDFGNFILGVAINQAGYSRIVAEVAGRLFNFVQNRNNPNPPPIPVDQNGVIVGWEYGANSAFGVYNDFGIDRTSFCRSLEQITNQTGLNWFDTFRPVPCGCTKPACNEPGPNLNNSLQSDPNWNIHVSTFLGNNAHTQTPEEELVDFLVRFQEIVAEELGSLFSGSFPPGFPNMPPSF